MSINSPFANPYRPGANLYARPLAAGGMVGRQPIIIPQELNHPPQAKAPKKHSFLKTLLYGGAAIGLGALALKRFSPQNYAKIAETAAQYTPAQATEFKNYLAGQAGKLKESSLVASALQKAEPLTNGIQSLWKKLVG